jgi:hypothetical protein
MPSKKQSKNGNKNAARTRRPPSAVREARPPPIRANIEVTHVYRFKAVASFLSTSITDANLLLAAGVAQATTTLAYPVFQTMKVKRVEIWSPVASQGTGTTCSVEWPAFNQSQEREVSDTTVSPTYPAHVSCVPPKMSLAGFWNDASAGNNLFAISGPAGSVIDVTVSLTMNDGDPVGTTVTTGINTVGEINYTGLDGFPKATTNFLPQGLTPA